MKKTLCAVSQLVLAAILFAGVGVALAYAVRAEIEKPQIRFVIDGDAVLKQEISIDTKRDIVNVKEWFIGSVDWNGKPIYNDEAIEWDWRQYTIEEWRRCEDEGWEGNQRLL